MSTAGCETQGLSLGFSRAVGAAPDTPERGVLSQARATLAPAKLISGSRGC
jgi:hypothetical protein